MSLENAAPPTQVTPEPEESRKRVWVEGLPRIPRINKQGPAGSPVPQDNTVARSYYDQLRAELSDLCSNYGRVQSCKVIARGTAAIVLFETHEDAENAIKKLDQRRFRNAILKARWDNKVEVSDKEPKQNTPKPQEVQKKVRKQPMSLRHLTPTNALTHPSYHQQQLQQQQTTSATHPQTRPGASPWDIPTTVANEEQNHSDVTDEAGRGAKRGRGRGRGNSPNDRGGRGGRGRGGRGRGVSNGHGHKSQDHSEDVHSQVLEQSPVQDQPEKAELPVTQQPEKQKARLQVHKVAQPQTKPTNQAPNPKKGKQTNQVRTQPEAETKQDGDQAKPSEPQQPEQSQPQQGKQKGPKIQTQKKPANPKKDQYEVLIQKDGKDLHSLTLSQALFETHILPLLE